MSLQRRLVLPPLALAIHPAPLVKKKDVKQNDDQKDSKVAEKNDQPKADGKKVEEGSQAIEPKKVEPLLGPVLPQQANGAATPDSPGSMIPEPPTPGFTAPPSQSPVQVEGQAPQVPPPAEPKLAPPKQENHTLAQTAEKSKTAEEEIPPPPLRLIGPVPPRPVKTRLELNPAIPYPPIHSDPRGAYYKYAKYNQGEWILIDVVKDGWLSEQWREKPERDALAMIRGESEMRAKQEAERARQNAMIREVPAGAERILLELWNDLVLANNHEIEVSEFWEKYDWSNPNAQKHLSPARKAPSKPDGGTKAGTEGDAEGKGEIIEAAETHENQRIEESIAWEDGLDDVEWTKEGLEVILGTVGVQCSYNTFKPLPRNWTEPAGAYLILGHGFFMLRMEDILQWKSEEAANKFELLVTSGHDRVFGEMVKAQQMEERKKKEKEYRERKIAEKKKAEQEAKRKKTEAALAKDKQTATNDCVNDEPVTPTSTKKVKDGEEVAAVDAQAIAVKGDKAIVAVPVPNGKLADKSADKKHEVEAMAAIPGEATKPEAIDQARIVAIDEKNALEAVKNDQNGKDDTKKKVDGGKDGKPFDPLREAELLAKMVAAGQTPPGMGMEDIKLAFKALEAAAGSLKESKEGKDKKEKEPQPYIWTWHDSCETWRWKNFEAGLHNVGPGGWEERDWKVFADDRGCDDFDREEYWAEEDERDIYDWSV